MSKPSSIIIKSFLIKLAVTFLFVMVSNNAHALVKNEGGKCIFDEGGFGLGDLFEGSLSAAGGLLSGSPPDLEEVFNAPTTVHGTVVGGKVDCGTQLKFGDCNVCKVSNSKWEEPKIGVLYNVLSEHGAILRENECKEINLVRFCARRALPGDADDQGGSRGNTTAFETGAGEGGPRAQLCAYEDPWDIMDSDYDFSPYHKDTPNGDATNISGSMVDAASGLFDFAGSAASVGVLPAAGGAAALGVLAGAAAGVGFVVGAITSDYNYDVDFNLGCVDFPIAEGPPVFRNDAWHTKNYPRPTLGYGAPSTFDDPTVTLTFCRQNGDPDAKYVNCNKKMDHVGVVKDLTPNVGNGFKEFVRVTELENGPSDANRSFNTHSEVVVFEARISRARPQDVCIFRYKKEESEIEDTDDGKLQGCLPRPGYMPALEVSRNSSVVNGVDIKVGNDMKTLSVARDSGREVCGYANQVRVCAYEGPEENNYKPVCVKGFIRAPLVAVDSNQIVIDEKTRPCNERRRADDVGVPPYGEQPFVNTKANYNLDSEGKPVPVEVSFQYAMTGGGKDVFVYDPPRCRQRDSEGSCIAYDYKNGPAAECCTQADAGPDGACEGKYAGPLGNFIDENGCTNYKDNVTALYGGDPYKIDPSLHAVRPMTGAEMGYCTYPVANLTDYWIHDSPGETTYTVPDGCSEIEVELWGAGAGGTFVTQEGSTFQDYFWAYSGGGGAYAIANYKVNKGEVYKVNVGEGGSTDKFYIPNPFGDGKLATRSFLGKNGGESSFGTTKLVAGGGIAGMANPTDEKTTIEPSSGECSETMSQEFINNDQQKPKLTFDDCKKAGNGQSDDKGNDSLWGQAGDAIVEGGAAIVGLDAFPEGFEHGDKVLGGVSWRPDFGRHYKYSDSEIDIKRLLCLFADSATADMYNMPYGVGGCAFGGDDGNVGHTGRGGHGYARIRCSEQYEGAEDRDISGQVSQCPM